MKYYFDTQAVTHSFIHTMALFLFLSLFNMDILYTLDTQMYCLSVLARANFHHQFAA